MTFTDINFILIIQKTFRIILMKMYLIVRGRNLACF